MIYAIITSEDINFLALGDEDTLNSPMEAQGIPLELSVFSDVFAAEKSGILPSWKATDHSIDLLPGKTPPYGPIYPLS